MINDVDATPPRHAKTETWLLFFVYCLRYIDPRMRFGYVSYNDTIASEKSGRALRFADSAGLRIEGRSLHNWTTPEGGGLRATGMGGSLTGHGLDFAVVDDPIKNRVEAESGLMRERHFEWFNDVLYSRIEPGGSCIVNMARWHPDDLAGRLITLPRWIYNNLPAISNEGRPLWPEVWSLESLLDKKEQVGEYGWASLYQGLPVPRGQGIFGDPTFYEKLPDIGWRQAMGIDLAYTAKRKSDYSVWVRMIATGAGEETSIYITDVCRKQVAAPKFRDEIKLAQRRWRGIPTRFYCSGVERGTADFMEEGGVNVGPETAVGDKFVRAQPFAAAWNAGKVMVPTDAPWLEEFLSELSLFTGVGDLHDDMVDAAAAAFDQLKPTAPANRLRSMAAAL